MIIVSAIICILLFVFIQTLINDTQKHALDGPYNSTNGNLTLASVISDEVLDQWIADPPKSTAWKASPPPGDPKTSYSTVNASVSGKQPPPPTNNSILFGPTPAEVQSDDSSVAAPPSKEYFLESLFEPPSVEVEADWSVVLGSFDHYDDENWKDFLIKTDVPILVRMFLSDSSETVTISQSFDKKKKDTKKGKKPFLPKEKSSSSSFEVLISTASWLLTHESKFRLGETYIEHDLDGTDSKNTFFFSSPRLLIHNKIKNKWRTAIIRHFDEKGLNMTFVDRDRLVTARRFFHRI